MLCGNPKPEEDDELVEQAWPSWAEVSALISQNLTEEDGADDCELTASNGQEEEEDDEDDEETKEQGEGDTFWESDSSGSAGISSEDFD